MGPAQLRLPRARTRCGPAGRSTRPTTLVVSPTYVPDLCHAALDLLIDGECGIWHLSAPDPLTWAALARAVADRAGLDPRGVVGRPAASFGWAAPRPAFSALGCTRGSPLPPLAAGLDRFVREYDPRPAA